MATEQVLKFLSDNNRPFNLNDIVQGLGQSTSKTKVSNSLNELISQKKAIEKLYGKQKIYCVKQAEDVPANKIQEKYCEIDRESSTLAFKLKEVEDSLETKNAKLKHMEGKVSMAEALIQKGNLEEEIQEIEQKIEKIGKATMSEEEQKSILKSYDSVYKEYSKRKRLCLDMINAIYENYPKTKKILLEEIGIETDEDVNFVVTCK